MGLNFEKQKAVKAFSIFFTQSLASVRSVFRSRDNKACAKSQE